MPDEAPAQAPAATEAAAAPAVAETPGAGVAELTPAQLEARNAAKMAKHVALTKQAIAADAGEPAVETVEAEPGDKKTPERGPDGKFLKPGEKAAAAEPKVKEAPAAAKTEPKAPAAEGSLGIAREHFKQGRIADAFKVAFGQDISEGLPGRNWEAYRRENRRAEKEIIQGAEFNQRDREVIQRAAQDLAPLIEAKKAWEAGDPQAAIKHAFGIEFNDFQKMALQKFHGADPEKVALRRELSEVRKLIEDRDRKRDEDARTATVEQRRAEHKQSISSELAASEDERFAAVATKRAFVDRVFAIQGKHYDKRSDTTLPTLEAAELALEEIAEEFGVSLPGAGRSPAQQQQTSVRGAQSAASGPGRTPVRQAKATSLRQSEAAEATAPVKLKGEALMQSYIKKAQAELNGA